MKKRLMASLFVTCSALCTLNAGMIQSASAATQDTGIAHASNIATDSVGTAAVTKAAPSSLEQQFITTIAPIAQNSANKYRLYPSVMMAQAILESGWGTSAACQAPNYNFFGIKGDYNGASFNMPTKEWSKDKGYYTVDCYFRKYPNMEASFDDNGNKLRNGLSWNASYYSGTWRENTQSYKDATSWLQGRYATDPNYAAKLNNLITTYNLTQYDVTNGQVDSVSAESQNNFHVVRTNSDRQFYRLYSPSGNPIVDRALLANTDWRSDQVQTINNEQFYRVSTFEWVRAVDVTVIK